MIAERLAYIPCKTLKYSNSKPMLWNFGRRPWQNTPRGIDFQSFWARRRFRIICPWTNLCFHFLLNFKKLCQQFMLIEVIQFGFSASVRYEKRTTKTVSRFIPNLLVNCVKPHLHVTSKQMKCYVIVVSPYVHSCIQTTKLELHWLVPPCRNSSPSLAVRLALLKRLCYVWNNFNNIMPTICGHCITNMENVAGFGSQFTKNKKWSQWMMQLLNATLN